MEEQKAENMYNEFMRRHKRRLLLSAEPVINTENMTDEQAIEELSDIVKKQSKLLFFRNNNSLLYSVAASIFIALGIFSYYYINNIKNNTENIEVHGTVSENKSLQNEDKNIKDNNKHNANTITIKENIALPKYICEEQEVFGLNQATDKILLENEKVFDIIEKHLSTYSFERKNNILFCTKKHINSDKDNIKINIEFKIENKQLVLIVNEVESRYKSKINHEIKSIKNHLEKYFNEIER